MVGLVFIQKTKMITLTTKWTLKTPQTMIPAWFTLLKNGIDTLVSIQNTKNKTICQATIPIYNNNTTSLFLGQISLLKRLQHLSNFC